MSAHPGRLSLERAATDEGVHLNEVDTHALLAAVALAHGLTANLVRK